MNYTLHAGDCLHELKQYPDNYFHSVVTDPPYGLGKEPDALEMLAAWMERGHYEPKARGGFMGRAWDAFVPQPAVWREIYRVMRPGAHLLTFGGTRTYDLLTLALRLAGFEIRDCIYWIYGSGFPKSRDISKAIDAEAGAERETIGKQRLTGNAAYTNGERNNLYHSLSNDTPATGAKTIAITAPATPAAREWDGWGTALKPSAEPIVLARKPIAESTIAANVLAWRAGAINVDAGRVAFLSDEDKASAAARFSNGISAGADVADGWKRPANKNYKPSETNTSGRWPANVILDEPAAAALDEMSGERASGHYPASGKTGAGNVYGRFNGADSIERYTETGGASRFFYCAKASRRDRDEGLEGFEPQYNKGSGTHSNGSANTRLGNAEERARGETHIELSKVRNPHPTVKPLALMRYLCRLITPAGGVILDPFAGSGSTGKAAAWEGFAFTGIELDPEHVEIARARIEHAIKQAEAERLAEPLTLPLAA